MTTPNNIERFNNLSEKYLCWIIKYCSTSFDSPLFLIWCTDSDESNANHLLTYKSGEIFAIKSLTELKRILLSETLNLIVSDNFNSWLENIKDIQAVEYCTYDLVFVASNIENNNLDIVTMEGFVNFINLYGDYVQQDKKNNHLQFYIDNELIKETWNYFYDYIFWPRFNEKENFVLLSRPQLIVDTKQLLLKLKDIIKAFDCNIRPAERCLLY